MLVLVKGDRRTGSQVNPTTQILVLVQGDRPMGSQDKTEKKKKIFFTKLTMQNIEEFCFVSIVKRGHLLLPNF
jgi:hypothetical protein